MQSRCPTTAWHSTGLHSSSSACSDSKRYDVGGSRGGFSITKADRGSRERRLGVMLAVNGTERRSVRVDRRRDGP